MQSLTTGGGRGCSPLTTGGGGGGAVAYDGGGGSLRLTQTAWQYHNVFDEVCLTDYLLFSYSGYLIILFV